ARLLAWRSANQSRGLGFPAMLKRLDTDKADRSAYHKDQSQSGEDRPEISETGRQERETNQKGEQTPTLLAIRTHCISSLSPAIRRNRSCRTWTAIER